MKTSTMLLVVLALLGFGSAIWIHTQRNEAIEQTSAALADKVKLTADLKATNARPATAEKVAAESRANLSKVQTDLKQALDDATAKADSIAKLEGVMSDQKSAAAKLAEQLASANSKAAQLSGEISALKTALAAAEAAKQSAEARLVEAERARRAAEDAAAKAATSQ